MDEIDLRRKRTNQTRKNTHDDDDVEPIVKRKSLGVDSLITPLEKSDTVHSQREELPNQVDTVQSEVLCTTDLRRKRPNQTRKNTHDDDDVEPIVKRKGLGGDSPTSLHDSKIEEPDTTNDSKKLLDKSPQLVDVLEVVTDDCDCQQFREALKIPSGTKGSLKDAINYWIKEEPSDVTWRNLLKGLKEISKTNTVRFILNNYLKRPSVYRKYIDCNDFESLEDLGI